MYEHRLKCRHISGIARKFYVTRNKQVAGVWGGAGGRGVRAQPPARLRGLHSASAQSANRIPRGTRAAEIAPRSGAPLLRTTEKLFRRSRSTVATNVPIGYEATFCEVFFFILFLSETVYKLQCVMRDRPLILQRCRPSSDLFGKLFNFFEKNKKK